MKSEDRIFVRVVWCFAAAMVFAETGTLNAPSGLEKEVEQNKAETKHFDGVVYHIVDAVVQSVNCRWMSKTSAPGQQLGDRMFSFTGLQPSP